jgi:alkylation response protein AidB-like acyl-CoA dehydrogenase
MDDELHPLVAAARRIADELLDPAAADTDLGTVPISQLRAIGAAGLLGLGAPVEAGGSAAPPLVFRAVAAELARGDAATWFVQAQHHSPVKMLADRASSASELYLGPLARGELVAGVAFSHLRRYPQSRVIEATRTPSGWRLDGVAPWYTGWGLNDVAFLSGITHDGVVVFGVIPAVESGQLSVKARIATSALNAASTVALTLDGVSFGDDEVADVLPYERWLTADQATSANANPAIFGVAASALRLLGRSAEAGAQACARAFGDQLADVQGRVDFLIDQVSPTERLDDRLALRAQALELLIAVTTALVTAGAGAAMSVRSPAQRKAREALFLLVQAQTGPARAATLARWHASARLL